MFKNVSIVDAFVWSMHFIFARAPITPYELYLTYVLPAWRGPCCYLNF